MAAKKTIPNLHYSSVAEVRAMVDAPWNVAVNGARAKDYTTRAEGDVKWYGMSGGAVGVMAALKNGFPQGEAMIEKMTVEIAAKLPRAVGVGRRKVFGEQGDTLDIHKVNRGDVNRAWESRKRLVKVGNTTVRIVCDIGGNCSVSAQRLAWRGVAALCLAEVMAKARYKVEIVAGHAVTGFTYGKGNASATMTYTIKAAGASADRGMLAAILCAAGFFRTLGFAAICRAADNAGSEANSGLGHSHSLDTALPSPPRMSQIIVPHDVDDAASAAAWVIAAVKLLQGSRT